MAGLTSILIFELVLIGSTFTARDRSMNRAAERDQIMQFNADDEPTIDPNIICKNFTQLNKRQQSICRKNPHAAASAVQGVLMAVHECQRVFTNNRWNCSNLNVTIVDNHPMLEKGYKELAFLHALTAASVVHQVGLACSLGKIPDCRCQQRHSEGQNLFGWKGCSHDLKYGATFARKFLSKRDLEPNSVQGLMQLHNSKIGRRQVEENKMKKCKCHGMSSSCEIKTCWTAGPDMNKIGSILYDKYKESVQVHHKNENDIKGNDITKKNPNKAVKNAKISSKSLQAFKSSDTEKNLKQHLIHFENSPTYCDAIPSIGTAGTRGRLCMSNSTNTPESCSTLCCGRGFFTVKLIRSEKCNCKFHWCCYVKCDKCVIDEWVTVCR